MSSGILALKALLGTTSVVGAGGLITAAAVFMSPEIPPAQTISVIVVNSQGSPASTTSSKIKISNAAEQDYQCRVAGVTTGVFNCKLVEITNTKKFLDLSDIKAATHPETPTLENLQSLSKHYKLEVDTTLFAKIDINKATMLELVTTASASTPILKLNTLFKVDDSGATYKQVSTVLGRATEAYESIDAAKQKQCLLTDNTGLSADHNCTFRSFGSSTTSPSGAGYSNQSITTWDATAPGEFIANKYYLLDYATPLDKPDLSKIYVNEIDGGTAAKKATLDNVVPVIFNGSGDHKKAFILSETQTFKGVVVKDTAVTSTKSLTFNTQSKTYKCKYASNASVNCELRLIPFTTTKTSHNTSDIKGITTAGPVSITATTSPNSYYKVEVESSFFGAFKTGTTPKSIQILDATDSSTRLFTLDILYSIDVNAEYEGESSYIVKSATLVSNPPSFADGDKQYCLFAAADTTDFTNAQECEIKDLGTTIAANQSFQTPTDATSILTTNTYLVTFIEASGVAAPVVKDIEDQSLLFLKVATGNDNSKTKVASFTKANIDYALIVDGDTNNKFTFVLNKPVISS